MKKKELYSARFSRSNRTFFFDIKETASGTVYLQISESKLVDDQFEHQRLSIFAESLDNFIDELAKAKYALRKISEQRHSEKKRKTQKR